MGASVSVEKCLPVTRDSEAFKKLLAALRGVIVGHEQYRRDRELEAQAAAFAKAEAEAEAKGKKPPAPPPPPKKENTVVAIDAADKITVAALREVLVDGSRRALSDLEFNTMMEDLDVDARDGEFKISVADIAKVGLLVCRLILCAPQIDWPVPIINGCIVVCMDGWSYGSAFVLLPACLLAAVLFGNITAMSSVSVHTDNSSVARRSRS